MLTREGKIQLTMVPSEAKLKSNQVPCYNYDVRYPSFIQRFNRRWFATNLKHVYLPRSSEGALQFVEHALDPFPPGSVKVQSGAHCYKGFVFNDNVQAIINVSGMDGEYGHSPIKGYYVSSVDTNWNAFIRLFIDFGLICRGALATVSAWQNTSLVEALASLIAYMETLSLTWVVWRSSGRKYRAHKLFSSTFQMIRGFQKVMESCFGLFVGHGVVITV